MGFSLSFHRIAGDQPADADRAGLADFLESRGLHVVADGFGSGSILDGDDQPLRFDGDWSDIHLSPLDQDAPLSGGIFHATLSGEECEFVYDLCIAGGFLVANHQGSPLIVVPSYNHSLEDVSAIDPGDIAWVESAVEFREAVTDGFEQFIAYRDRVLLRDESEMSDS